MVTMSKTTNKFSPEFRERAVRMIDEHRADFKSECAAMTSIAGKIGCTAETLRRVRDGLRLGCPARSGAPRRHRRRGPTGSSL
jgi:transposase